MDIRLQMAMVFHLDKCIGCHTCSIACKNVWTDRKGAEYMWWNNVETKPGTGYPTAWEDQQKYHGGWEQKNGQPDLRMGRRELRVLNIFHNPHLPKLDDYYEPWTYKYEDLFDSPEGADQPTARPISMITGKYVDIEAGPNWDDDLGGSPVYAANDPIEKARLPMKYIASLFAGGNLDLVRYSLKKQYAVRLFKRLDTVGDMDAAAVKRALEQLNMTEEEAEQIFRLTALPLFDERFVIPPSHREQALQMLNEDMWAEKGGAGFGFRAAPVRGA
jgi:nitrate reductase beta subunit